MLNTASNFYYYIIFHAESCPVLSPASVSRNDASHPKRVLLGYLAESFIYIRDWYRETMSVILCDVVQQKRHDMSVKKEQNSQEKKPLTLSRRRRKLE
jgi:hypothetical protein